MRKFNLLFCLTLFTLSTFGFAQRTLEDKREEALAQTALPKVERTPQELIDLAFSKNALSFELAVPDMTAGERAALKNYMNVGNGVIKSHQTKGAGTETGWSFELSDDVIGRISFPLVDPINYVTTATIDGLSLIGDDEFQFGSILAINNNFTNGVGEIHSVNYPDGTTNLEFAMSNVPAAQAPVTLAFDETTNTAYVVTIDAASLSTDAKLHTLNPSTGELTEVGDIVGRQFVSWMEIDSSGNAYIGDYITDELYSLDLTTGAATLIGSFGQNFNFGNDATFSTDESAILVPANLAAGGIILASIDPASGSVTSLGNMPGGQHGTFSLDDFVCGLASFTTEIEDNCETDIYFIRVTVNDFADASLISVTNDFNTNEAILASPGQSTLIGPFPNGTEVEVRVSNFNDKNCCAIRTVQNFCPSANDDCENAIELSLGTVFDDFPVSGFISTTGDTPSSFPTPSCENTNTGTDLFYTVTIPAGTPSGILTVETRDFDASGASDDSVLAVYEGGCDTPVEVACADGDGIGDFGLATIRFDEDLAEETTLIIRVMEFGNSFESLDFLVSAFYTEVDFPENDECTVDAAFEVPVGALRDDFPVLVDNNFATNSGEVIYDCAFFGVQPAGDVWYSFVATAETIFVETFASGLPGGFNDTILNVYEGDCSNLTQIECAEDTFGLFAAVELNGLTVGERYYISTGVWGDDFGNFLLSVFDNCVSPEFTLTTVDDCADDQFFVEVEITNVGNIGAGELLEVSDNQGSSPVLVAAPTTVTFGPYTSQTEVSFTVAQQNTLTCSASDVATLNCTLSTTNIDGNGSGISVYPNPTTDFLTIEGIDAKSAQVFTMTGQRVNAQFSGNKVDVTRLQGGLYILSVVDAKGNVTTKKFIKR